jgi:hypothetical protein
MDEVIERLTRIEQALELLISLLADEGDEPPLRDLDGALLPPDRDEGAAL